MGIKVGMVGVGSFAQYFIPLFKSHPLVDEVILCDLDAKKLKENSDKHGIPKTSPSLDHLCTTDVDAVVIITQHWLHAPQAIQALKAGKHVYSAVPTGITIEEIGELVKTVEETGKIYMIGETSYYSPGVVYCRNQHKKGAFGHIVYGEAEYYHEWDHGSVEIAKSRAGDRWLEFAGLPPMYYPTHSTSQIISVTGAYMTHVSCLGYVDRADDGIFKEDVNIWKNTFSNEAALFRMSDGSMCRINEFRRIGHPCAVRMNLFGTEASFEMNTGAAMWETKYYRNERLDDQLECREDTGFAAVHPVERLPKEYANLPNGHGGSHQFLVDDYVKACAEGKRPPNNVWDAARYAIPGIIAHESAKKGGALLEIPDFGDGL